MKQPTPREIVATERGEHHTFLRLSCGHDRSIGGNFVNDTWGCGSAHLLTGAMYPCVDGHCGKSS